MPIPKSKAWAYEEFVSGWVRCSGCLSTGPIDEDYELTHADDCPTAEVEAALVAAEEALREAASALHALTQLDHAEEVVLAALARLVALGGDRG